METLHTSGMRHPHAFTLQLLGLAIQNLPPSFPDTRATHFRTLLDRCTGDVRCTYGEIHEAIVSLGKESWSERMAYQELYDRYGRASEEANLLENLDEGIREKYERFVHEGGKINHIESAKSGEAIWGASPFERYFTPEEKFGIEQALLAARTAARKEINELLEGAKSEEFAVTVDSYKESMRRIQVDLDRLRELASVSEKWEKAISDKVHTFEEGWSVVEKGFDEEIVAKELEYWQGTLESFLNS